MLYQIMLHIRNFFPTGEVHGNEYKIENGTVSLPFVKNGQYFMISGSVLNDGVYQYPATELKDEIFYGNIELLAPPRAFLDLVAEIEEFNQKSKEKAGLFQSESFGGYSYTLATNSKGNRASWKDVYQSQLNTWRKI